MYLPVLAVVPMLPISKYGGIVSASRYESSSITSLILSGGVNSGRSGVGGRGAI